MNSYEPHSDTAEPSRCLTTTQTPSVPWTSCLICAFPWSGWPSSATISRWSSR